MIYDPINILWVEDNPLQNALYGKQINERTQINLLDNSFANDRIPAVFFNEENRELYKFFSLKVLQHPEEIREYVSVCLEVEDKKGAKALGDTNGAIPEIIVFDYKLFDGIDLQEAKEIIPYIPDMEPIRRMLNPIFEIYQKHQDIFQNRIPFFEDANNRAYQLRDFIKNVNGKTNATYSSEVEKSLTDYSEVLVEVFNKDKFELENDQLGLFAGVVISRLFKEHSCVAIPATFNFSDLSRMHISSKFFEWVNGYDLGDMFSSEDRGKKGWDKIIPQGVKKLRIRIEKQVESGKIVPNYNQLINLSKSITKESVFSFTSIYGERNLPLDGLFIDEPEKTRIQEIKKWANSLIEILPKNNADIKKAEKVSTHLWKKYYGMFIERLDLSDYKFREMMGTLKTDEKPNFAILKRKYCKGGKIKKEYSIQNSSDDLKLDKYTFRLAVLHLVTKAAIEMNKLANENPTSTLYSPLLDNEYLNILFPFVNYSKHNPLILPMHVDQTESYNLADTKRKWLADKLSLEKGEITRSNCLNFKQWMAEGEKTLLRSIYFDDKKFYPNWLE